MKLVSLIEGREAATQALQTVTTFEASYALNCLVKDLGLVHEEYTKKQSELVNKYGQDPDPNNPEEAKYQGKIVPPSSPNFATFRKELEELLNKDVDVSFKKLKPDYFKGEKISGVMVNYLMPFFEE